MEDNIFVAIFLVVFISIRGGFACFTSNTNPPIDVKIGTPLYLTCQCKDPGNSVKSLKWIDIHNQVIGTLGPGTKSMVYTEWSDHGLSLHIPYMSMTMTGDYKCVIDYDGQNHTLTYRVEAYEPLHFINEADSQYIINGKDSLIRCEPRSDNDVRIIWHKGAEELIEITRDEKYEITAKGLIIRNVSDDDAGIYKCSVVVLQTGDDKDLKIKVDVVTVPRIHELKITPDKTVVEGEPLSIECKAEGMPHPEYSFNKTSGTKPENITWRIDTNTIIFDSINADDRGKYACIASNVGGNDTSEVLIEVLVPPSITALNNVTVREGSIAQITCKATGRSKPTINFTFQMEGVDEDPSIIWDIRKTSEVESSFTLTFQTVNRTHAGSYICNASNEVDYVTEVAYLEVLYKPYFEQTNEIVWGWHGETVNLSCEHESNPPSSVVWRSLGNEIEKQEQVEINKLLMAKLNNMTRNSMLLPITKDTLYGVYECIARNDIGETKKTITLKQGFAPPPIKNVWLDEITARSVTFNIVGPDEVEGPAVTGFTCEYDESKNYNTTHIHRNRTWSIDRPYKLEKLKPYTVYYARFCAQNQVGGGPYSATIEFKTPEKSVPDIPTFEDVKAFGTSRVLKWKTPEDNGDPIDYYVLTYCPMQDGEVKEEQCKEDRFATNEIRLTDLNHNTTYFIQLLAHNSQGNSPAMDITIEIKEEPQTNLLSASAIIGIAVGVVILCLIVLDILFFLWRKQGIMASCCYRKKKKGKEEALQSRDTKGLLKDTRDSTDDTLKCDNNGHKEYQYNKNTGVITGKHSAV